MELADTWREFIGKTKKDNLRLHGSLKKNWSFKHKIYSEWINALENSVNALVGILSFIITPVVFRLSSEGTGTPLQYPCLENPMDGGAWWAAVHGVAKSRTWLSNFTFTFHFPALEKEMATHSSVLAWRIPGMGEPGGLPSLGSHRVGHDWSDVAAAAAAAVIYTKEYILWCVCTWVRDFSK